MQDLVAGQIDMMIDHAATLCRRCAPARIKAYAVTAKNRLAQRPISRRWTRPACRVYISNWQALWAPKGTPKDVIARLNAAVVEALADPAVRARLADLGQEIFPREQQTPEALGAFQKAEIEKWWPIIKAAGIKAE